MNTHDLGDLVFVTGTFTDPNDGSPLDPTTVAINITTPAGVETSYVFGTDVEVENPSVGIYIINVDANEIGVWTYEWVSTGTGQASEHASFEVIGVVSGLPAYATRHDIELIFGRVNVAAWADVDNDGNATFITARINWALSESYYYINNKLLGSSYVIPFETTYPVQVVSQSARYAGIILYEARGIVDKGEKPNHQLTAHRKMVDEFLHDVQRGKIRLGLEEHASYPAVID